MTQNWTIRQQQILDTAMRLISEGGVQGLTMRQMALALDLSEAALYRHFASKQAILAGLLELFEAQVHDLATQNLQGRQGGMRRFFMELLERLEKNPVWSSVIFSEEIFQNEAALAERVSAIMDYVEKSLCEHAASLKLEKSIPPRHVAWMFLGSVRLLVTRWRLSRFGFSLTSEGAEMLGSLCHLFHLNVSCTDG